MVDKIELLVEGDSERTMFSAKVVNEIITAVNAILAMQGAGGTRIYKSDAKFVIWSGGSGSAAGGGITSSVVNNYTCNNRYA